MSLGAVARRAAASQPAPFDPTSITGLFGWWRADHPGLAGLADGTLVNTWSDSSGNARTASQATTAKRPTMQTVNGLRVVRFDGSDDEIETASIALPAAWTAFALVRANVANVNQFIVATDTNFSSRHAQELTYTSSGVASSTAFNTVAGAFIDHAPAVPTNWQVLSAVRDATTVEVFVEGVSDGSTATTGTPSTTTRPISLGGMSSVTQSLNGDMREVLYYSAALSPTDRQSVETYLQARKP